MEQSNSLGQYISPEKAVIAAGVAVGYAVGPATVFTVIGCAATGGVFYGTYKAYQLYQYIKNDPNGQLFFENAEKAYDIGKRSPAMIQRGREFIQPAIDSLQVSEASLNNLRDAALSFVQALITRINNETQEVHAVQGQESKHN